MTLAAAESQRRPSLQAIGGRAAALNLAFTFPLAFLLNVWQDDAYTLDTTGRGIAYALHQSIFFEQNAPLYFLFLSLWRHINGSFGFARLFSVLCVAATVYLVPQLVRRYAPGISPVWVTFVVALNPFLIWVALEIRLYALVVLLSTSLLLTFYDGFLARARSRRATLAYGALSIVAAYTQYYLVFLILAQGLLLLATRKRVAILRYVGIESIAALAFVPMLFVLPAQLANFRGSFTSPSNPLQSATILAEIAIQYAFPLGFLSSPRMLYAVAVVGAAIAAVVFRRAFTERPATTLPAMTAIAFVIFSAVVYAAKEHVLNRHGAVLFTPVVISTYAAFTVLRRPSRERAVAIWSVVLLCCSIASLYAAYRPMAKIGDWARVNAYISTRERPGQPIVIFEAENAVPFAYYYRGANPIVAVPTNVDFRTYDIDRFVLRNAAQIDRSLAAVGGKPATMWLVTGDFCHALNIDFGCGVLDSYVARNYRTLSERHFYRSDVRLLQRRVSVGSR
ncbi:MAG TPA: hypothetical protein VIG51_05185 [Candidatus Baltobacteraceae bacterium]|jgi:hypothetical protein